MRLFGGMVLAFGVTLAFSACSGKTTGATNVTSGSATLTASASCDSGEVCRWYWEYWEAGTPRFLSTKTPVQGPVRGPTGTQSLSTTVRGLRPNTTYRWVLCGSPNDGGGYACAGPNGTFGSTTADPPPDYATFTTGPQRTLAERWNGTNWAIQPTPNPTAGVRGSFLKGVSCTSATACTAVGYYDNSAGTSVPLAERWNGTNWTIEPTPLPSGALYGHLWGVSCTSANACTAVGDYFDGTDTVTLAQRWNGTTWTIQPTPEPSGAQSSSLRGVSCTSATACTAVGGWSIGGDAHTLAMAWNGTTWGIQPSAGGATIDTLLGVSCTSATACTAVGITGSPSSIRAQAQRWNGTTWTIQPTPVPSGALSSDLSGVSCVSATACIAVGSYFLSGSGSRTLAEAWNGTAWTIQPTPNPSGAQNSVLRGVSCTSATACTAVGDSSNGTLAVRWNGTSWTIQPTPNPTGLPSLSGVSCTSGSACTAVGEY